MVQVKTAEEWQQEIDEHREQNLRWIANIGAYMARTDARMDHLETRFEAFMDRTETMLNEMKDMRLILMRLLEQRETNGTGKT